MPAGDSERKVVATNRRARFEYEILDTLEAGIALLGPEVKSLRAGRASLSDAYATIRRGEVFLVNAHVSPYEQAGRDNPEPRRERKLLLKKPEIRRLQGQVAEQPRERRPPAGMCKSQSCSNRTYPADVPDQRMCAHPDTL